MVRQPEVSRRRFIQSTAAGSLALAGMGLGRVSQAQSAKPNILFIMADDLGYADLSCYGQSDYVTQNIDRLAIEGVRYTQGYANSSVCSATRTALATGRYQYRLPVGSKSRSARRLRRPLVYRLIIQRCPRCLRRQVIAPLSLANGTSAFCRTSAR